MFSKINQETKPIYYAIASLILVIGLSFMVWQDLTHPVFALVYQKPQFVKQEQSKQQEVTEEFASEPKDKQNDLTAALVLNPVMVKGDPNISMLFVGDVMLGRHVETLMRSKGEEYLFANVQDLFEDKDLIMGNLEGPILANHVQTPNGSVQFSFSEDKAKFLKDCNFDLVSLANNHTDDYGEAGFEQTQSYLRDYAIESSGHPIKVDSQYVANKMIKDQRFSFISFNAFDYRFDRQKALELIKQNAKEDIFVIVNIHWGIEYVDHSNQTQQTLAHEMIDNGADLIIGHHPHVVQEVEEYNNKLIFYSLGNFVFDQYWSQPTQKGLAIDIKIEENETHYTLLPIQDNLSQLNLMADDTKQAWLNNLANRSDADLRLQIEQGEIVLRY